MTQLKSHNGYYLWNYVPSMGAAVFFILLFIVMTGLHGWRMFKTRTWFCIPFFIGCFFEIMGYIGRALAHNSTDALGPYILQSIFTLVAPALFAASIYMTLGRIMRHVKGEHHSVIRINWLTRSFVIGDVLSFMVQANSAALMFKASTVKMGENLVLVGLFIQVISFGLFFVTAVIFERRMRKEPTAESFVVEASWLQHLRVLYTMSVLIMIRSIFRVVEYAEGQKGYSLKHEWTLYMFDAVPMFIVTVIYYVWYPSELTAPLPSAPSIDAQGIHLVHNQNDLEAKSYPRAQCDESRPGCVNCSTANYQCSYLKPPTSGTSTPTASVTTPDSFKSPSDTHPDSQASPHPSIPLVAMPPPPLVNLLHLELFQLICTGSILLWDTSAYKTKPVQVVKMGFSAPYLMHELLACAALYLYRTRSNQNGLYHEEATKLQGESLRIFNEIVKDIDTENIVPAFLYSGILGFHLFIDTFSMSTAHMDEFLDRLVHSITIMRGIRTIFSPKWWAYLKTSEISDLLQHNDGDPNHKDDISDILDWLRAELPQYPALEANECQILQEAVEKLRWSYVSGLAFMENGMYASRIVTVWPITVSSEYSDLLAQRRPGSLLVLAYFSIILHVCRNHWAVGQSGIYLLNVVGTYLGEGHEKWLQGPRSMVFQST
ncbi:RTA1 domain protein [Rutstroemia sp. NJR-2017a WRK4]|nr:RTA1 domain protein [Rutstroemia sp. NJR-2017a WRK4]